MNQIGRKINVIFCGYRDWALSVIDNVIKHPNINCIGIIKNFDNYRTQEKNGFDDNVDIILFIGWSWIVPKETTSNFLCLGIHPSDLPNYRGGSPLQHQIINGIKKSKVTLMTLSEKELDAGDIWMKTNLSLRGDNVRQILKNVSKSSIKLLTEFFNKYPDINPEKQKIEFGSYFKRRSEKDSRIYFENIEDFTLLDIYNNVRCLTDPYPNFYIEDSDGNKLYLKKVEYISAKNND